MSLFLFIPGSLSFGLIQTTVALEQCVTVLRNKQECTLVSNAIRYSVSIRVIAAFQELIVFSDVYQGDSAVGTLTSHVGDACRSAKPDDSSAVQVHGGSMSRRIAIVGRAPWAGMPAHIWSRRGRMSLSSILGLSTSSR